MALFGMFKKFDINASVREYNSLRRAMLIDVREANEYKGGHIPGARNIPFSRIEKTPSAIQDKDMPLYVYCLSGSRSEKAVKALKKMGYTNVKNIGGYSFYSGKTQK